MMEGKVAPYPLSLPCGLQQGGKGMEVTNRLEGRLTGLKIETLSQTPIVETLKKARALILDEKNWIKGQEATIGKDGPSVSAKSPEATCFCLTGALGHVIDEMDGVNEWNLVRDCGTVLALAIGMPHYERWHPSAYLSDITGWNDATTTTHKDVIAAFDKAIASCS